MDLYPLWHLAGTLHIVGAGYIQSIEADRVEFTD